VDEEKKKPKLKRRQNGPKIRVKKAKVELAEEEDLSYFETITLRVEQNGSTWRVKYGHTCKTDYCLQCEKRTLN
jgi:hypothetical protein